MQVVPTPRFLLLFGAATALATALAAAPAPFQRIRYHNPGLAVDVGVGLWGWPLPTDVNGDGRIDLVLAGSGKPYNGVYYFENTGVADPDSGLPRMAAGVRLGAAVDSPQVSYVDGRPVVLARGAAYPDFLHSGLEHPRPLGVPTPAEILGASDPALTKPGITGIRSSQWKYVDFDGDGRRDLIVGIDYWGDYQWATANSGGSQPAYDANGRWKYGPLHGYVYLLQNTGTNAAPSYAAPVQLEAGGKPIDVYGRPSPCFADFRHTGKLDLICGEFIDGFTYFENLGTRSEPRYAAGRPLALGGVPLKMDLCMITPTAVDFDDDGDIDLVVGQEDGRVALLENTGVVTDGMPQFLPPRFFTQVADEVKFGVLSAPSACDLDGDGQEDLVVGDSAGYVGFIQNLGGNPPRWAAPVYLQAGGRTIHIQAGYNGDCQGPSEVKWGYTNVCAADWDLDGRPDILCSDVWGKVYWYRNLGNGAPGARVQGSTFKVQSSAVPAMPAFAAAQPIEVEWPGPPPKPAWNWWDPQGKELVIEWRCTPYVIDWNRDGLPDLVTLDHEGYLALFERRRAADGRLVLLPGQRVFYAEGVSAWDASGRPLNHTSGRLRLNGNVGGASGRRTFCFTDWDGDGVLDLMVNSINVNFLRGLGRNAAGQWVFKDMGPLNPDQILAGHSTAPTVVHWAGHKEGDLLFGTEDGFLYLAPRAR